MDGINFLSIFQSLVHFKHVLNVRLSNAQPSRKLKGLIMYINLLFLVVNNDTHSYNYSLSWDENSLSCCQILKYLYDFQTEI